MWKLIILSTHFVRLPSERSGTAYEAVKVKFPLFNASRVTCTEVVDLAAFKLSRNLVIAHSKQYDSTHAALVTAKLDELSLKPD